MPRLSLYRPEKGNDYKFIDKNIWEMFQVGGTDVLIHKYLGPGSASEITPSTPGYISTTETQIQDLLFLENRDRKYDPDVYILRGVYNVQDTDFNLSQFGLFLQNDTVFISFHINDTVEKIGRKLMSGDVIELPHLKDDHALNDLSFALKRFYVIEEISRASEGFSVTWYPHLYRAKCKPLVDSQEYKEILDGVADTENYIGTYNSADRYFPGDIVTGPDGKKYQVLDSELTKDGIIGITPPNTAYYELAGTLREIMSTYEKEMQITQAVLDQAESDAPKSGYDTSRYYHLQKDTEGNAELVTVDSDLVAQYSADRGEPALDENGNPVLDENGDPVYAGANASTQNQAMDGKYYDGYITEDGIPANGAPFSAGIAFPVSPTLGQYCLRKDYLPNRLFRFNGTRWVKIEDVARMTMNNLGNDDVISGQRFEGKDVRQTQKTSFINNDATAQIDGRTVKEKQGLSKALRPKADE
jgi:hypothetical protein